MKRPQERATLRVYVAENGWYCTEKCCGEAKICPGCGFRAMHPRTAFRRLVEVWLEGKVDDGYDVGELLGLAVDRDWVVCQEVCEILDLPYRSRSRAAVRAMLYRLREKEAAVAETWADVLDEDELVEAKVVSE